MVALRGKDIAPFLTRPDPARPVILLYGADSGLVRERADALIASAVDDPKDPFAVVRLEGDDIVSDPARLVDEAMTVPLFGGRRAIRVRAGSRNFAPSVEALTTQPIADCRIVIEAGELRPDAPLRKVCERAKNAAAIPCYSDGAQDLGRLIDEEMKAFNLRITPDARATLIPLLGGDRLASRNELRKLALYAHGQSEVTLDDVAAIVTDASPLAIDPIIDGAFAGQPAQVETAFNKALASGVAPFAILYAAQRHVAQLHLAALAVSEGNAPSSAVSSGFPRLHFSRTGAIETALRNNSAERLAQVMSQLASAVLDTRRQSDLASTIARRALMAIATNARRRG